LLIQHYFPKFALAENGGLMDNNTQDIRWHQRFISFKKAYNQLERFVAHQALNEMEEQGLIKAFEYTFELAWKTLQDLLKEKGYNNILGPRPVIEQSFQDGYITRGKEWLTMHNSRNLTSHTYDKETADEIVKEVRENYLDLFKELHDRLEEERSAKQNSVIDE
jgi:nucleotidyltransferase substrate binding protein (TIGR01987 family)